MLVGTKTPSRYRRNAICAFTRALHSFCQLENLIVKAYQYNLWSQSAIYQVMVTLSADWGRPGEILHMLIGVASSRKLLGRVGKGWDGAGQRRAGEGDWKGGEES